MSSRKEIDLFGANSLLEVLDRSSKALNPAADSYHLLSAKIRLPLKLFNSGFDDKSGLEIYSYNLLDQAVYQPEMAGVMINTNPLRAGRSIYLTLNWQF